MGLAILHEGSYNTFAIIDGIIVTVYSDYSHNILLPQARVLITAVIVLLLCNRYSCYSLGQLLYYYQLITHFNPRIIRATTVPLLVLIALAIALAITGHTRTSKSTDYYLNCTQKCV